MPSFSSSVFDLSGNDSRVECISSTLPLVSTARNVKAALGSHTSLQCMMLNARSIVSKRLDLFAILEAEQPDVLAVTETFLSAEILDSEITSGDYNIFRVDRNRRGGGVMVYVKSVIPAVRRHDLETACELLWVELSSVTSKVLLGVFYRPPDSPADYLSQLEISLAGIPSSQPVVLCGDFNSPGIDWSKTSPSTASKEASLLCDLIQDYSLQQLVVEPTRENNILDLILTNIPERITDVRVTCNLPGTDHLAVDFLLSFSRGHQASGRRWVYNFKKADFNRFRDLLSEIQWNSYLLGESIEEDWQRFKDVLSLREVQVRHTHMVRISLFCLACFVARQGTRLQKS